MTVRRRALKQFAPVGPWKHTTIRDRVLFVYWKMGLTPVYIFRKQESGGWVGHDQKFSTVAKALEWVEKQPSPV
jgi:hypothetical protein